MHTSHRTIIELYGTIAAYARATGQSWEAARKQHERNRIPPQHWEVLVADAEERGFEGVDIETLTRLTRPRGQPEPAEAAE